MSVRLFVGKLPFDTTEVDLREYFSQVGAVSAVILPTDRETGKKRGFAFVDFEDKATAENAIRRFNNGIFHGRTISVSEARPREERGSGERSGPAHSGSFPRRNRLSGGGIGAGRGHNAEPPDDFGEIRPSRHRGAGKSGSRKKNKPKVPQGPIRERRSGRLHDLGEENHHSEEVDFENLATSAPPREDDSEE
ncbi:MAG: RNA-binding protein [Acidobacteria bacterium]|nr:RNA-binding protein [Acidobacteriota bacterium]